MDLAFVPLLSRQREIYEVPRGPGRFAAYLRLLNREHPDEIVAPLLIVNPMARGPVAAVLDALLALDADHLAARAVAEAATTLADAPGGSFRVSLVLADDAGGGWTNRYAWEFSNRFERPPAAHRDWRTGVLWSSDPPTASAVREAVRLAQEGEVMRAAGCTSPTLDAEELAYIREIIRPHLEATDLPTAIVHLFGDPAAHSLGYRPVGLSRWAGLALSLHDTLAARLSTLV